MSDKALLRQHLRRLRSAVGSAQRQLEQKQVHERLLRLFAHRRPAAVASYCPLGAEIDPLLEPAQWRSGGQLYWPQVTRTGLKFAQVAAGTPLRQSHVGAWQPHDSARTRPLWSIPIVVMPLVGCDAAGFRLGQGGGYYDRALARSSGTAHSPWASASIASYA